MNVVEFDSVWRTYRGGVTALRDLTLAIPQGRIYGVLGRNGAGKTTLLRMIPALLHPTRGTVRVFGADPWEREEVKQDIGYLSESEAILGYLRVRDLVELCADLYRKWDGGMAAEFLARFGLDPGRRMKRLSKGQRRQVGLMLAVCHRPKLLVLDEPAGGLDPVARRGFLGEVLDLLAESGSTILFSSHILSDLERIATDIVILHEGRVLLDRPLDDLKERVCRVELEADAAERKDIAETWGVMAAREQDGRLTAVVPCAAAEAADWVAAREPSPGRPRVVYSSAMGLEDLFIELTGDLS